MSKQPLPTEGRQGVTQAVIDDLRKREQKGIKTYGRSLQTFNGRDALQDLYEELIDALQYLKQLMLEQEDSKPKTITWEYLAMQYRPDSNKVWDDDDNMLTFDALGADGWELVTIISYNHDLDSKINDDGYYVGACYTAIFKRKIAS